jgi:hypothetical protein
MEREAIWYCKRDLRFPVRRAAFLHYRLFLVMVRSLSRIHPPIFSSLNICLSFLSSLSLAQLGRELHLRKLRKTLWTAGDGSLKTTYNTITQGIDLTKTGLSNLQVRCLRETPSADMRSLGQFSIHSAFLSKRTRLPITSSPSTRSPISASRQP